ncbi:MAG: flagellar assembly protein FliW [Sulfuricurvum sp.]
MQYTVKSPILGFEQVECVELKAIDDLFSTLVDCNGGTMAFTVVNPYLLREYSFDVSSELQELLGINENSKVLVYNVAVIQNPLSESCINFLAPLIFNEDNATMAQAVLDSAAHPELGIAEPISKFLA